MTPYCTSVPKRKLPFPPEMRRITKREQGSTTDSIHLYAVRGSVKKQEKDEVLTKRSKVGAGTSAYAPPRNWSCCQQTRLHGAWLKYERFNSEFP